MKLLYVFKERAFVIAICNSLVLRDDLFTSGGPCDDSFLQDVRFAFRLLGRVNTK